MINLKNMNLAARLKENFKNTPSYKQKLKALKTWAQMKSPKVLQPALSYTLGWLSPELLGTGFRMVEISDFEIKALVPSQTSNLDQFNEINQGLVLNGSLELARNFIQRYLPESYFKIDSSEIKISKKHKWDSDIAMILKSEESVLDQFFSEIQENKKAVMQMQIKIEIDGAKKADSIELKLICEATNLLA
ncbi:MAG: hypothetical protein WA160_16190 [Pseudobdellovibrio sp.]